jgi:glycolate oxidase FAD binding subunit
MERPGTFAELAEILASCGRDARTVRIVGGGTKQGWGTPQPVDVGVSTSSLTRIAAHNVGDLTAVLEAGVSLRDANEEFAAAGQMLALDPPDPGGATIGGIVATADSGPLRHRYLGVRDLVLGMTVALSDGTIAKSGGTVIKNVAGYDLAKLFAGSFGTLGAILKVAFRLHPLVRAPVTIAATGDDPSDVADCALDFVGLALEAECLDLSWDSGGGGVFVRLAGVATDGRARRAVEVARGRGLDATVADDREVWERRRAHQRADDATVCRVSVVPARITRLLALAQRLNAGVSGRVAHGAYFLRLDGDDDAVVAAIEETRAETDGCVVLDAPDAVREKVGVWGNVDERALGVMRAVKRRLDPAGIMAPGSFVGGI